MDHTEELEMWAKKWDAAQAKWAAEDRQAPQKVQKVDNFFGLQNNPVPEETVDKQQGDEWWKIYDRSNEIRDENPQPPTSEDQMFTEQAQGWRKLLGTPQVQGKQQPRQQRPQQQQQRNPNQPMGFA